MATLNILVGPKLKVKCELELTTDTAAAATRRRQNVNSWGFMSGHAKETGLGKGLCEPSGVAGRPGGKLEPRATSNQIRVRRQVKWHAIVFFG